MKKKKRLEKHKYTNTTQHNIIVPSPEPYRSVLKPFCGSILIVEGLIRVNLDRSYARIDDIKIKSTAGEIILDHAWVRGFKFKTLEPGIIYRVIFSATVRLYKHRDQVISKLGLCPKRLLEVLDEGV